MAHSSCMKCSISIDLFNLPMLPDEKKQTTMFCKIPNDSFLPDRKNSRLSHIINTWTLNRLTLDGNEGVGVEIEYLEHAYGTRYYVVDQINGHINVIYDDSLEITEFTGHFSPFNLDELELKVCRIADNCEGGNDPIHDVPAPQHNKCHQLHDSVKSSRQQNIEDLTEMGFNTKNYSPIHAIRNTTPQQPMDVRSGASIPTLMPRPQGGS